MTKKEQIIEMRNQGMTYQAIADEFDCTKQNIHLMVNREPKIRFSKKILYPNIRNWCIENRCTMKELCEKSNISKNVLYYFFRNDRDVKLIKRILKVTGMTFEEAFGGTDCED